MSKRQSELILRVVLLVVALINQILSSLGKPILPIANEDIESIASSVLLIISVIWAAWKNNSFTVNAQLADEYLDALKSSIKISRDRTEINVDKVNHETETDEGEKVEEPGKVVVPIFPTKYVAITRLNHGNYYAIDNGWNQNQGGMNVPIFASYSGEIIGVTDGKDNNMANGASYGNCIVIYHPELNAYTYYAHLLKGSLKVKTGDKVVLGQEIANMGNSGYSFGNHLHFEWRQGSNDPSSRVNPLNYVYATKGHFINAETDREYQIKRA